MEHQTNRAYNKNGLKFGHAHEQSEYILDLVLDENVISHVAHENREVAQVVSPISRKRSHDQILDSIHVFRQRALTEAFNLDN